MATKTISIMDDVYELLTKHKKPAESFSDELRRVFSKEKKDIMQFAGAWSKETAQHARSAIQKLRADWDKEMEQRTR